MRLRNVDQWSPPLHLPAITIEAADPPDEVLALLDSHFLDLGGTYGDPQAGDLILFGVEDGQLVIDGDENEAFSRLTPAAFPFTSHETP